MTSKSKQTSVTSEEVSQISHSLEGYLRVRGFEAHPFLTGWYDARVSDKFSLGVGSPDTLAFIVLSQPSMFEKAFLPFLTSKATSPSNEGRDPLDSCILNTIDGVRQLFPQNEIEILHDFELRPNRRPKVLVQTAAHVSGSVRFFQPTDVSDQEQLRAAVKSSKIYPVCLHPQFGGWFAIRAVVVLKDLAAPWLKETPCSDPRLQLNDNLIIDLLSLYNDNWQDWRFRDVISSKEKYSELQQEYFATKPAERHELVKRVIARQQEENAL